MNPDVWTVRDILNWTTQRFVKLGLLTPLLDAHLLLGNVLGLSKVEIYLQMDRTVEDGEKSKMRDLVKRRVQGEPVAYLLKQKYWHDLDLFVDNRVLIPRPETESLLDFVLSLWKHTQIKPSLILDLCTGSGCLSIALAKAFPMARVYAVDISESALEVAHKNAERNGAQNVEFLVGDVTSPAWFDALRAQVEPFNIVVSNPPYVSELEWQNCETSVREFEPKLALVSQDNGLALSNQIVENVWRVELLAAQSCLALESGIFHPFQIATKLSEFLDESHKWNVFPNSSSSWEFPRSRPFGLRDLSHNERFFCFIQGLNYVAPEEDLVSLEPISST